MLNNIASLFGTGAVATSYESIATVTVGAGGSASIDFTSIPSTYKHLQIRGINRDSDAGTNPTNGYVRFNSDSATNYSAHYLLGDGASATASAGTSTTGSWHWVIGNGAGANVFAAEIIDILDYADTNKYKTIRLLSGGDNNGNGRIFFTSGSWRSTSAITSISLLPSTANFKQYTTYALYGVKG